MTTEQTYRHSWQRLSFSVLLLTLLLVPTLSQAQIRITLKDSFIERNKNRATIDINFTVDKAHARPNPASKDGDLHIAGRAPEVGLPIVAELMNAKDEEDAVDLIHQREGTDTPVRMSGAWRLWSEHGGDSQQIQGAPLSKFKSTNPDHVFEIHPVTKLNGDSVLETLRPIPGFKTKDAETAFMSYENKSCQIIRNPAKKTTTIVTGMAGFNYVEFRIELNEKPFPVEDGTLVFATVMDLEGEVLVRNRRMVFIKGSPPEAAVRNLDEGDQLHVLGVPRINLALVSYRTRNAKKNPGMLTWNLPYEMLIVGIYAD